MAQAAAVNDGDKEVVAKMNKEYADKEPHSGTSSLDDHLDTHVALVVGSQLAISLICLPSMASQSSP